MVAALEDMRQLYCAFTAVISNCFSVVRLRDLSLNQCSSHVQTAHSVRGRAHLKWIRGSYNKHSHKTIITHPGSTVPSRYSRQHRGAVGEMGMSYLHQKSTYKERQA